MEFNNQIIEHILATRSSEFIYHTGVREFLSLYGNTSYEDVDWVQFCDDISRMGCYKLGFEYIYALLSQNKYKGSYSEILYQHLDDFNAIAQQAVSNYVDLLCGERIKNLIIFRRESAVNQQIHSLTFVPTENSSLFKLISSFYDSSYCSLHHATRLIMNNFATSLGQYEMTIQSFRDFNAETFHTQIENYKKCFSDRSQDRKSALYIVCSFYRWLVRSYPEYDFFKSASNMTESFLFNRMIRYYLENDYYFTTLNPNNIPYGHKRICFIVKGFENYSTQLEKNDSVSYDLSNIESDFYRDLLIEYIVSNTSVSSIMARGLISYISVALEALCRLKVQEDYPNKSYDHLTNQEAVFIRRFFDDEHLSVATRNNKIGSVRRFVSYCIERKAITVDELFFEYLTQYEEPVRTIAKTASDETLVAINNELMLRKENSLFYKEMFVIFHLAIQTEFRINQICHLRVNCLKPTMKPNQFAVVTNSKTSHGRKENFVVSTLSYNLIMDIIEETEAIRRECCISSLKDYIFIFESQPQNYRVFNNCVFTDTLKALCRDINVPKCTARQLRYTHMTKALEHIMRNGKSDMEMSILSRHRHLDTTMNHYIELELEKMLESTYGITIGTELIETDTKIKDSIPEALTGKEHDVENGCGKCTAETCMTTNALPCLACKYFITTPKHERFFKKAINNIDRLISCTKNRHDIEDLVTMKELYVLYLKAIIKHKEGIDYDN